MTDEFVWLARQLDAWPTLLPRPNLDVGSQLRFVDALEQLTEINSVGEPDLAVLIRQILRRQAEIGGGDPGLRVPEGSPWPSEPRWRSHGLVAVRVTEGGHVLRAEPWRPTWLAGAAESAPAQAAEGEVLRRIRDSTELGDGFLEEAIGETTYSSPGQQQAMRTVLASKDTATIIVSLPTGTGKSSVFTVPAYVWSDRGGVTVVVVPTTTLALDQERGIRAALARGSGLRQLPARLAFHSALTADERHAIYSGIRDGTQTVVLTSPEGLTGALAPSLYAAARAGHLRAIAIDEAHIVAQWGVDFRPDFQAAAGLRTDLLKAAHDAGRPGFKTILLTGTLTQDALETLLELYGRPGPLEFVSSVSLRAEPSYWLHRCADDSEKERFLLDALRHLPRPLLLYTTRVDHAYQLADRLRWHGYRRLAVVTGQTSTQDRQRAIEGLTGRSLMSGARTGTKVDVVVATSAFGLGIDQPDIRSVVHACVPETLDRYYQEVGRGGRDGRACVSLVLYTEDDLQTARSMNRTRIISVERGFERWEAMRTSAVVVADDVIRIPLGAKPSDLMWDSEHNEDWNLRTLTLMSRAGMIELQSEPPLPRVGPDDNPEQPIDPPRQAVIRVIYGHLADRESWETQVREARRRTHDADVESLRLMEKALSGTIDLADIFQAAYTIDLPERHVVPRIRVLPQRSCGGCPNCRRLFRAAYQGVSPRPDPVLHPRITEDEALRSIFAGGTARILIATYPSERYPTDRAWIELCERLVSSLARHGVRNVIAPESFFRLRQIREMHRRLPDGFLFFFDRYAPHELPDLPTVVIRPRLPADSVLPQDYLINAPGMPRRVLIMSADTRDPERPAIPVSLVRQPSMQAEGVLARL
jgi:ATP-dependent DNA helicase RecQ